MSKHWAVVTAPIRVALMVAALGPGIFSPPVAAEAQPAAPLIGVPAPPDPAEFPRFDSAAASFAARGATVKALARRLAESPHDADMPRLLADQQRFDEMLVTLRRIVELHPDRIAHAFQLPVFSLPRDGSQSYSEQLLALVALARTRLAELPREDAATADRALVGIELQLNREPGRNRIPRLEAFIENYAGTDTALLSEVDLIQAAPITPARLAALEAFAARHPRTAAAAKARFEQGMDLAVNAMALRVERPGDDPLPRFTQVAAIARALQSGEYPRCEWTERAPELLIRFSTFRPKFPSSDSIDMMLNAYRELLGREVPRLAGGLAGSPLDVVITRAMANLFEARGERIAGVERVYSELARVAPDPSSVKYARALFYSQYVVEPSPDRAALVATAVTALRATHADGVQPFARRALATLASLHFHQRDYAAASAAYREYVSLYPASDWTWVARMRIGECAMALDDLAGAARAYAAAANAGRTLPVAQAIALALSADTLVGLGQVSEALRDARRALAAWDNDYGDTYRTQAAQARQPGESPFALNSGATVTKTGLQRRVSELAASAAISGGAPLEQGRALLARHRSRAAIPLLRRAVDESRGTALEAKATGTLHHAQLLGALAEVGVGRPEADRAEGVRLLDALGSEPIDFYVFAARVARATILAEESASAAQADRLMTDALHAWLARQPLSDPAASGSLEADLDAIRAEVFRPLGDGVYGTTRWNAFEWPTRPPAFLVANPELSVRLAGGESRLVSLRRSIQGLKTVIFMSRDELDVLTTMMSALGGNARREPTAVMETPNQPTGPSLDVRAFWIKYFPTRPGHWFGWVFETYPTIVDVTFLDAARTRASVRIVVGYSGGTVMLVKEGGEWRARELAELWVT